MENDINDIEELLVLYALGELEPDEASAVEEELQKRPELAAEVEKVRRADGLLSDVFAQSDEAAQQTFAEESVKSKASDKSELSHRLARRFAFTAAALSLFFTLVALLYPQFVSKDVQVAMTSQETTESKSVSLDTVTEGVKIEEPATAAEEQILEEAQEEEPQFALNAIDDAEAEAEDVAEEADEDIPPAAAAEVEMDMAEADMDSAAPALEEDNAALDSEPAPQAPEPEEEAHAQYFMRNALFDVPSQKTVDGMAPIKGEIPPMKEELLPEESLGDMAVDQMNKRLKTQRSANAVKKSVELNRKERSAAADAAPVLDSFAALRKSVLEENKLPDPGSVKVEQWLNYFGVAQPVKAKDQERKSEAADDKDAQFVKAVNQFAGALSSSEPADVKAFEEVLDLLKDSVGDDPKRLEFKAIVEKTIEIKKKSE